MDCCHPLSTPMVVRSLDVTKDSFRLSKEGVEILGPEVPYLSIISALLYLANNTHPDIAFAVNLLARYNAGPTQRHWKGVKYLLRYLKGTIDLGLFYKYDAPSTLIGFADAGYIFDPQKKKITDWLRVHLWRHSHFFEISQADLCCSFIKPCRDPCHI